MTERPGTRGRAAARGGRRQVTIAFVDLVGSTALSHRLDPEDFEELLGRYHRLCEAKVVRFGRHVEQFQGDGVLCCFGYPAAHEDDAARAVRAALEIAGEVARLSYPGGGAPLQVRIGIATGLAVVDVSTTGAGVAVGGETPNVAARVQAMAEPGSVAIAGSTRRIVEGEFELAELGAHSLKGIAAPQDLWRVLRARNVVGRFEARSPNPVPLVGRASELGILLGAWARAAIGAGEVVLVSGEPGIGKSRLIRELALHPAAQPNRLALFQCLPQYENTAFWLFLKRIDDRLGEAGGRSAHGLAALLESAGIADADGVALLAPLLSIEAPPGPDELRSYSPEKKRDRVADILARIVTAETQGGPALVVIEDVHWSDPTTIELAGRIAARLRADGGLLIISFRPEFDARSLPTGDATRLALDSLDVAATTALIRTLTAGRRLPDELVAGIAVRTDGVPLFVEELTRSVLESGIVREVANAYELAGEMGPLSIPLTLKDSLMARLDRLGAVREIAQIGSAIGREFSRDLLAAVAPVAEGELDAALDRLIGSGLIAPTGTAGRNVLTFRHALIQDAAYESMLRSTRQRLHGELADAIADEWPSLQQAEPEVLARHLTLAGRAGEAAPLWLKAGHLALARSALPEAIASFSSALAAIAALPRTPDVDELELAIRSGLAGAYIAQLGWASDRVRNTATPARVLAARSRNDRHLVTAMFQVWVNFHTRCEYASALEVAEELIEQGRNSPDPSLRAYGQGMAAQTLYHVGRFTEALERLARCAERADFERDRGIVLNTNHEIRASSEARVGTAHWILGYPDRARQSAEDAIAYARSAQHPFNLAFVLAVSSHTFFYRGDVATAASHIDEALGIAANQRLASLQRMTLPLYEGRRLLYLGRFAEGLRVTLPALDAIWAGRQRNTIAQNRVMVGRLLVGTGDLRAGLAEIESGIALADETGDVFELAEFWRIKGETLERLDRPADAETSYRRAMEIARGQQARSWELRAATSLSALRQACGETAAAKDVLRPVVDWFPRETSTPDLLRARTLLDAVDRGL